MSKQKAGLDLSGMFANIPTEKEMKEQATEEKTTMSGQSDTSMAVPEPVSDSTEDTINTVGAKDTDKTVKAVSKPRKRGKPRINEELKVNRTFSVSNDVWEDMRFLARIRNRSISQYIEDLMVKELKKNEELIKQFKSMLK